MDDMNLATILAIAAPFIVLQWGLNIFALIDLAKRPVEQVKHLPKWGWAVAIVLVNFLGSIAYLVAGREDA